MVGACCLYFYQLAMWSDLLIAAGQIFTQEISKEPSQRRETRRQSKGPSVN